MGKLMNYINPPLAEIDVSDASSLQLFSCFRNRQRSAIPRLTRTVPAPAPTQALKETLQALCDLYQASKSQYHYLVS